MFALLNNNILSTTEAHVNNPLNNIAHGLWTPRESFFRELQTFGPGQTNWAENLGGILGIFGLSISTHFGTVSPLSHVFNYSTIIS